MENYNDSADPLDLAFANPKAGKKLKPGEVLPGLENASPRSYDLDDVPAAPDPALSQALDDAFSNPNFGAKSPDVMSPHGTLAHETVDKSAVIEEELARSLDDAFANPKAGNRIEDAAGLENLGLGAGPSSSGLNTPRLDDLDFEHMPPKSGFLSPKFLVIAMLLAVVVGAVVVGGSGTTASKPTLVQLD